MFKEMRRKDRSIDNEQAIQLLKKGQYGVLSTVGENGYAYGVPLPARKIWREWRFSKKALVEWISSGDSYNYSNQEDTYAVYDDKFENYKELIDSIYIEASRLKEGWSTLKFKVCFPSIRSNGPFNGRKY